MRLFLSRYGDSLALGNESLYDLPSWVQSWVALVKSVLENVPAAHGRLLIDLINEPDGWASRLSALLPALYMSSNAHICVHRSQ